MTDKFLLVDIDACVRCYACEVGCRQENGLSFETKSRWCRVQTVGPREVKGELYLDFLPVMCLQCRDPLCAQFCPVEAISKKEDGRVVIDEEACIGCRQCTYGCPYGAMYFNEVTQKAGKCNLCLSRTEAGIEPSCVQHCIGGSLRYVNKAELEELTRGRHWARLGETYYLSSKWKVNPLSA
ncbi:MAG: 4Fe-4S binding protein [Deltaproteobacteria bacterium]|nr:4Fe-4S binding protein [Deltaproteobacteria bacterium]